MTCGPMVTADGDFVILRLQQVGRDWQKHRILYPFYLHYGIILVTVTDEAITHSLGSLAL